MKIQLIGDTGQILSWYELDTVEYVRLKEASNQSHKSMMSLIRHALWLSLDLEHLTDYKSRIAVDL